MSLVETVLWNGVLKLLIFLISSIKDFEAGFLLLGLGMGTAMAGQTGLKVVNKPQKYFILQF